MKILLVEDQAMIRGALSALLAMDRSFEIVQAVDGEDAIQKLRTEHFDILLTDIEMPRRTGLEVIEWIKQRELPIRCMIITTFGRAGYIRRALDLGVNAFLLKDAPSDDLIAAIHEINRGKCIIDSELALLAIGDISPLIDKERRALRLAGEGKTTSEIADILCISSGTVRNYLSSSITKLNASNRADAVRLAHQKGWL